MIKTTEGTEITGKTKVEVSFIPQSRRAVEVFPLRALRLCGRLGFLGKRRLVFFHHIVHLVIRQHEGIIVL